MQFDWQFVTSVLQILVIDVVLSGDNAVVIAMAAHRLPEKQRRTAILCGAAGAIVLRVLFTWVLAQLLGVPLLRFGGGVVLVWIAIKLLLDEGEESGDHKVREASSLFQSIWIIIMADFVMSLDNMLAVGGASEGHASLILFGLVMSIAIIMTCSVVIARLMNRFPVLVVLGAAVLAWTSAEMILQDAKVAEFLVTRQHLCVDVSWHDEFGGTAPPSKAHMHAVKEPNPPKPWWVKSQDDLQHRHWMSWAFTFGIIGFVIAVPRCWKTVVRRRGNHNRPHHDASAPAPPQPPAHTAEPPPAMPSS